MKAIVMTHKTQGNRKSDFQNCVEGEIARRASVNGVMVGVDGNLAGTTMEIVELDITPLALKAIYTKNFIDAWGVDEADAQKMAQEEYEVVTDIANSFPVNSVIEIRGRKIVSRV